MKLKPLKPLKRAEIPFQVVKTCLCLSENPNESKEAQSLAELGKHQAPSQHKRKANAFLFIGNFQVILPLKL